MASELLDMDNDNAHTKETDVWAFGMTLYVWSFYFLIN